jgi:hypothetical protein
VYENSSAPFIIRGVLYQYKGENAEWSSTAPLAQLEDGLACQRDIQYLTQLGVNTILIDSIRPSPAIDYSACMEHLQKAGIYVLIGLNLPNKNISARQVWDRDMLEQTITSIDSFIGYTNVLGYYVTGTPITTPYIRAAMRDLKLHIRSRGRKIPVGFLGRPRGRELSDRLNCGDQDSAIDFLVHYVWDVCADTVKLREALQTAVADHSNYSTPMFLHIKDCSPQAKNSEDLNLLFQPELTTTMSGAILYSYFSVKNTTKAPGECLLITG